MSKGAGDMSDDEPEFRILFVTSNQKDVSGGTPLLYEIAGSWFAEKASSNRQ